MSEMGTSAGKGRVNFSGVCMDCLLKQRQFNVDYAPGVVKGSGLGLWNKWRDSHFLDVPPPGGVWKSRYRIMAFGLNAGPFSLFLLFNYTGWSISSMPIKFGGDVVYLLKVGGIYIGCWG